MLRQIIIPDNNIYPLQLPDDYIGQKVEVIAFTLEGEKSRPKYSNSSGLDQEIEKFYRSINVKVPKDFKFNRDEAHER